MVSRQFHKLKYAGSSPVPRTKNDTAKRQSEIKNQTHTAIKLLAVGSSPTKSSNCLVAQ